MITEPITIGCIFHLPRKDDFYVVVALNEAVVLARRLRDGDLGYYRIDTLNQFATLVYRTGEVVPFDESDEYRIKPS